MMKAIFDKNTKEFLGWLDSETVDETKYLFRDVPEVGSSSIAQIARWEGDYETGKAIIDKTRKPSGNIYGAKHRASERNEVLGTINRILQQDKYDVMTMVVLIVDALLRLDKNPSPEFLKMVKSMKGNVGYLKRRTKSFSENENVEYEVLDEPVLWVETVAKWPEKKDGD